MTDGWLTFAQNFGFPALILVGLGIAGWRVLNKLLPVMIVAIQTHVSCMKSLEKSFSELVLVTQRLEEGQAQLERLLRDRRAG